MSKPVCMFKGQDIWDLLVRQDGSIPDLLKSLNRGTDGFEFLKAIAGAVSDANQAEVRDYLTIGKALSEMNTVDAIAMFLHRVSMHIETATSYEHARLKVKRDMDRLIEVTSQRDVIRFTRFAILPETFWHGVNLDEYIEICGAPHAAMTHMLMGHHGLVDMRIQVRAFILNRYGLSILGNILSAVRSVWIDSGIMESPSYPYLCVQMNEFFDKAVRVSSASKDWSGFDNLGLDVGGDSLYGGVDETYSRFCDMYIKCSIGLYDWSCIVAALDALDSEVMLR